MSETTHHLFHSMGIPVHVTLVGVKETDAKKYITEAENIFKSEYSSMQPDFFIVTDFEQFQQQPGLKEFLEKNYQQLANHQTYLIFDLKRHN